MRTLEEIKRDLHSYRAVAKRQKGATLYAEKYIEDVGALVDMIEGEVIPMVAPPPDVTQDSKPFEQPKRRKKEKTPKPE